MSTSRRITNLFIVPHGDDEVLAFGGTIAKLCKQKKRVVVAFLCRPCTDRTLAQAQQTFLAQKILGYADCIHMNMSCDPQLEVNRINVKVIEGLIHRFRPRNVYTVSPSDVHQDHSATNTLVSIATRPSAAPFIKNLFFSETISSACCNPTVNRNAYTANYYTVLDAQLLHIKQQAFTQYATEYAKHRNVTVIEAYARVSGTECGTTFAEGLHLARSIE